MNQTSIKSLFAKEAKPKADKKEVAKTLVSLASSEPLVTKYYETLSPQQRIAHEIAVEKLGTSYDVTRTHGYLSWLKTLK